MLFSRKISAILLFLCFVLTSIAYAELWDVWVLYKKQWSNPINIPMRLVNLRAQEAFFNWVSGTRGGSLARAAFIASNVLPNSMKICTLLPRMIEASSGPARKLSRTCSDSSLNRLASSQPSLFSDMEKEFESLLLDYMIGMTYTVVFFFPYQKAYSFLKNSFLKTQALCSPQKKSLAGNV